MATYAGRYDELLLKHVGNRVIPATSATVTVYESDGITPAPLFTDRTKATAASNPVSPDSSGNLEFFAAPGSYVLSIVEDSSVVATNTVAVQSDPNEPGSGDVASVNGQTGAVVLDADDIDDATTLHRFASEAQLTKLDGVETGATADQTGAEIKVAYEAELDTNAYTDAEKTKLAGVETGATADQTAADIRALGFFDISNDGAASGFDADLLDGSHASAFATAAQGTLADSAVQGADSVGSYVATSEATTSVSFTDLTTVGPSVTVDVGSTGKVLVVHSVQGAPASAVQWYTSVDVSGANTRAATVDQLAISFGGTTNARIGVGTILTGLTAGSTTFKQQYRSDGTVSVSFLRRQLTVIPL